MAQEAQRVARTVTVACNLPHGVVLRAFRKVKFMEAVIGGGSREQEEFQPVGDGFTVRGVAAPALVDAAFSRPEMAGGYALTRNVPAELWENWLEANKDSAMVVNDCIKAYENGAEMSVKRLAGKKSGLEPLATENDPRMPHRRPGVTDVTQGNREAI